MALTLTLISRLDVWRWWCSVGLRLRLERCNDTGKKNKGVLLQQHSELGERMITCRNHSDCT